jgi:hypothetical protein
MSGTIELSDFVHDLAAAEGAADRLASLHSRAHANGQKARQAYLQGGQREAARKMWEMWALATYSTTLRRNALESRTGGEAHFARTQTIRAETMETQIRAFLLGGES